MRWLSPLISLSAEEEAGFAREQWRAAGIVFSLCMVIMALPNCYNAQMTYTTIFALACACSLIVAPVLGEQVAGPRLCRTHL